MIRSVSYSFSVSVLLRSLFFWPSFFKQCVKQWSITFEGQLFHFCSVQQLSMRTSTLWFDFLSASMFSNTRRKVLFYLCFTQAITSASSGCILLVGFEKENSTRIFAITANVSIASFSVQFSMRRSTLRPRVCPKYWSITSYLSKKKPVLIHAFLSEYHSRPESLSYVLGSPPQSATDNHHGQFMGSIFVTPAQECNSAFDATVCGDCSG